MIRVIVKILMAYLLIGHFSSNVFSQNQQIADSLKLVLDAFRGSDSTRFVLANNIAQNSASPDQVLIYGQIALNIGTKANSAKWQAISYIHLGDGNRLKGDLSKAVDCYLKSADLYSKTQYKLGEATAYSNLGVVYRKQENYPNSIFYYNKAISIFRSEQDSLRLATSLMNAGELFREIDTSLDSAIIYFEESGNIFTKINYPIGTAYNLGNLGLVYAELGMDQLAEKNINDAISILEELGDRYPIAVYETSLADIYAKRGDYNRALSYANSSLKIAQEEGLKEQIRDASLKLSELYQSVGDFQNAYQYQSQYITYRDSINNEEVIRKMADLRTEYEVGQKQAEVDLLNQISQTQQLFLIVLAVAGSLLLVLAFVWYKFYRVRTRSNRLLADRRKEIAKQRDQLEDLNKTKDRFFSLISHDLRGPIANFQSMSQLIRMLVESDETKELLNLSQVMDKSARELSTLLDNLLHWAMSQQGKFPYLPERIDLSGVCQSTLDVLENSARVKSIKLGMQVDQEIFIWADKNSVMTIIRNLINNSIKFTPSDGSISVKTGIIGDKALIEIADTGVGMPPEKVDTLFDFEGRRSKWGTAGEKGVGLGLTLTKEFVDMNKGTIEVSSQVSKGSVFTVYFPLHQE